MAGVLETSPVAAGTWARDGRGDQWSTCRQEALRDLLEISPAVVRVSFPLEPAGKALKLLDGRAALGKVVLMPVKRC